MSDSESDIDKNEGDHGATTDEEEQNNSPVALIYPDESAGELEGEYDTYADFEKDLKRYMQETKQTFVKARSNKIASSNGKSDLLLYRPAHYACVHHKEYVKKGPANERSHTAGDATV